MGSSLASQGLCLPAASLKVCQNGVPLAMRSEDLLASQLFQCLKLYSFCNTCNTHQAVRCRTRAALECSHRHIAHLRTPRLGTYRMNITTVHFLSSSEVRCSTFISSEAPGIRHLLTKIPLLARHARLLFSSTSATHWRSQPSQPTSSTAPGYSLSKAEKP